jgi:hypothetical protein
VRHEHTPSSRSYNYFADPISVTPVGPFFSHPRRFTTALCTYPENPTRLISSMHKSFGPLLPACPDHIYPLRSEPEDRDRLLRRYSSSVWLSSRRSFVAWPIDRVRIPLVTRLRATGGDSRTCTIFFVHPRLPLSVFQGQHSPQLDLLLFIKWTTFLHTVCHADSVATPFPRNPF